MDRYLEHMRNISLFKVLSTKDLQTIAQAGEEVTFPAGSVIVEQDSPGHEAFVLLAGSVVVTRYGKEIGTFGPGIVIGEMSLLDNGPRTATVSAVNDCTMLLLDRRHFNAVLEAVPALTHKLLAMLASRVRELDGQQYG